MLSEGCHRFSETCHRFGVGCHRFNEGFHRFGVRCHRFGADFLPMGSDLDGTFGNSECGNFTFSTIGSFVSDEDRGANECN